MKMKLKQSIPHEIEVCDLIMIYGDEREDNRMYMVMKEFEGFTLRNLEDSKKSKQVNWEDTLAELMKSITDQNLNYVHYSKKDYELVLQEKTLEDDAPPTTPLEPVTPLPDTPDDTPTPDDNTGDDTNDDTTNDGVIEDDTSDGEDDMPDDNTPDEEQQEG